jgi:hypothetical protein
LDLFLEVIPETLVSCWTEGSGHGNRVLEGYLGVLNAGTKFNEIDGGVDLHLCWIIFNFLIRSDTGGFNGQRGSFPSRMFALFFCPSRHLTDSSYSQK